MKMNKKEKRSQKHTFSQIPPNKIGNKMAANKYKMHNVEIDFLRLNLATKP